MTDPSPHPDPDGSAGAGPDTRSGPGTPGWVKASAIIVMALIAAMVILHLSGLNLMNHMPMSH